MQPSGVGVTDDNTDMEPGRVVTPVAAEQTSHAAALIEIDAAHCVQRWSRSAERLFGHFERDILGQPLSRLFEQQGSIESSGVWCTRADGSRFRGEVRRLQLDDGAADRVGLVIIDVTSRCAVEEADRELRKRLDRITAGLARLVLFSIDVGRAVVEVSDGFAEIIGWTRGTPPRELASLLALVHPTDRVELERRLAHAIATRGLFEHEFRLYADLGERWLRVVGHVVESPLRLVGTGMDVTERRALERQVLDVSEQLQRQIGQDLHDGLGQLLTGTAFLAKGLLANVSDDYQAQANRVVELINQAITRVRSLARGLSPIHVEAQSLVAVLRDVVAEGERLLGVDCSLDAGEDVDSDEPATIAQLCLIVREAMTNAVRHGQAKRIVVRLARDEPRALLSIEDDGSGIKEATTKDGLGLRSMRHRASAIGGTLEVRPASVGTIVRCWWG